MGETNDNNYPFGRNPEQFTGFIDRTDTSAKYLFTLPAGVVISKVSVYGYAASDATSTATISVGLEAGSSTEILSGYDVKTAATGAGFSYPNSALGGSTASNSLTWGSNSVRVSGKYAETGTASSVGGPWQVTLTVLK